MKRVSKVFFAWNMKKEKEWLEDMARQGYVLKVVKPFIYYFEETEPQDLVYQFDFQILSKSKRSEYLEVFKDWTYVSNCGSWFYFYKVRSTEKENKIYSDNASKKAMYRRLIGFLLLAAFPLYYQVLIMFPNLDQTELQFPNFYFFMRLIIMAFLTLHTYAVIRLLFMMLQYKNIFKE